MGKNNQITMDMPLKNKKEDKLNYQSYAESIAELIESTEEPFTIGIQGAWGQGKTSFINLIKEKLNKNIKTIVFNSWQFADEEKIGISLITYILIKIVAEFKEEENKTPFFNFVKSILKKDKNNKVQFFVFVKSILKSLSFTIKNPLLEVGVECSLDKLLESKDVSTIKDDFQKLITECLGEKEKLIIVIDDLDRISPLKAIEILDYVKNFLDVAGCIFIITVDPSTIEKGIAIKYGLTNSFYKDDEEYKSWIKEIERNYLSKIIQLPFNLPNLSIDDCKDYIEELFPDFKDETKRKSTINELMKKVTNLNPRELKRLANIYTFYKIYISKKDDKDINNEYALFLLSCFYSGDKELKKIADNIKKCGIDSKSEDDIGSEYTKEMDDTEKQILEKYLKLFNSDILKDEEFKKGEFLDIEGDLKNDVCKFFTIIYKYFSSKEKNIEQFVKEQIEQFGFLFIQNGDWDISVKIKKIGKGRGRISINTPITLEIWIKSDVKSDVMKSRYCYRPLGEIFNQEIKEDEIEEYFIDVLSGLGGKWKDGTIRSEPPNEEEQKIIKGFLNEEAQEKYNKKVEKDKKKIEKDKKKIENIG